MSAPWARQYPLLTENRLAGEQALLARTYPRFRLVTEQEHLHFRGPMVSNYGSVFHVEIRLPERYPEQEPHLWVLSPTLPDCTLHRYQDGRICAHAGTFVAYHTTVAAMVSVMAGWIFRFDRERLQQVSWDEPIEVGAPLSVNPDGSLYLRPRT